METLETCLAFAIYVAALEARKKRKNQHIVTRETYRRDVAGLARELGARGLTL